MKPPYSLTSKILSLCTDIALSLGLFEGHFISKPEPKLRKSNRVRTIQASLAIEGNTLALDQVTAIFDGKKVVGPRREILEIQNAIKAYDKISSFKPYSAKSLLGAHHILMDGLIEDAGKWRTKNVGVFQGEKVAHAAPQAKRVPQLMEQLFAFIKSEKATHVLILSAVFHYELEFIHPFSDGNGRIGRLWQTTVLRKFHPIFEFTPIESAVRDRQEDYYKTLGLSDKAGDAGPFIEFSLETILAALTSLKAEVRATPLTAEDRLEIGKNRFAGRSFSRRDYLELFKAMSTATASRDLALGVRLRILQKTGDKAQATYVFR